MSGKYPQAGFQKGNQLAKLSDNPGRKVYDLEVETVQKIKNILVKDLEIIERIQSQEKVNPTDEKKLAISQSRVAKYLDKFIASKTDITSDGKQININIAKEVAEQNDIK